MLSIRESLIPWLLLVAIPGAGLATPSRPENTGDGAARPMLHISSPEFNWGKAFRGEQLAHEFVIENKGNGTLIIEDVKPNCGCMLVKNDAEYNRRLEPGEKTTILLQIDTRTLEPGFVKNKFTEIITNAIADENRLTILGEIEEILKLSPPHPTVDFVRGGPPASPATFTLEATGGRKVRLRNLLPRQGILTAALHELQKESIFEIRLTPKLKDLKTVFQNEDLETTLEVDGRTMPFRMPVAIKIKDRIEVEPSQSVFFRRADTEAFGQPGTTKPLRTLELKSLGGPTHSFKVTAVSVKDGVFAAAVETVEVGRRYRLKVTLEKAPKKGERFLKDTIELTTDDPVVPTIKIPATAQF